MFSTQYLTSFKEAFLWFAMALSKEKKRRNGFSSIHFLLYSVGHFVPFGMRYWNNLTEQVSSCQHIETKRASPCIGNDTLVELPVSCCSRATYGSWAAYSSVGFVNGTPNFHEEITFIQIFFVSFRPHLFAQIFLCITTYINNN